MTNYTTVREHFNNLVGELKRLYNLTADKEHECIYEFFEGPVDLFKLILVTHNEEDFIVVSFHLDLDSTLAIEWFLRLTDIYPPMQISPCYLKDVNGVSCAGEDAEVLKMYQIEQEILSNWIQNDQEEKEVLKEPELTKLNSKSSSSVFMDKDIALKLFSQIDKIKDDKLH